MKLSRVDYNETMESMIARRAPLADVISWYVAEMLDREMTMQETADILGISVRTLTTWREQMGVKRPADELGLKNLTPAQRDRIENRSRFNVTL
jgi:hypothetical protein